MSGRIPRLNDRRLKLGQRVRRKVVLDPPAPIASFSPLVQNGASSQCNCPAESIETAFHGDEDAPLRVWLAVPQVIQLQDPDHYILARPLEYPAKFARLFGPRDSCLDPADLQISHCPDKVAERVVEVGGGKTNSPSSNLEPRLAPAGPRELIAEHNSLGAHLMDACRHARAIDRASLDRRLHD